MAKATLSILLCGLLAGCATSTPRAIFAPRDLAGTKLEFTDLHSTNTYQFIPGGRYRFAAVSQNGLQTDRREGSYVCKSGQRYSRISFDKRETLHLNFENADSGTCQFDGDVRAYRFRLATSPAPSQR